MTMYAEAMKIYLSMLCHYNEAVRTAINRRLSPERLTVFDTVRVRKNQRKIELMEVYLYEYAAEN